ncbi:MAG: 2-hydroxyacyl-CoA dehydratase [Deltaproteobacteria bacterium]|nr:2-hydroxyacyl-CoA dehydratase [Deltaproteobacteria bacterium]
MMQQFLESTVSRLQSELEGSPRPQGRKRFALEVARLGARLFSKDEKVAWCGLTVPFDLLSTMGVTSCFIEFVGSILASSQMASPFLDEAEHMGCALDTCAYHRAVLGAAHKGMIPTPDFLIASSAPCSGGVAAMETLARGFKRDLFVLHVPQSNDEPAVRYLADQLREMEKFISDHTGKSLDRDRLRKAIVRTNEARGLLNEVFALAQQVPSPVRNRDLGNFGVTMSLLFGSQAAIEIAQAYRDEFAERIRNKNASLPENRIRLLWIQNRIQFKTPLIPWLEEKFQTSIVIDELNSITWEAIDPEDPYLGLARRAISNPFNGPIEYRIQNLKKLAKKYQIHGAINPCHWGCRQGTGARGLIESGLKEIGVPVLNLEIDCIDSRNFAEGQVRTRLEAFLEMIQCTI